MKKFDTCKPEFELEPYKRRIDTLVDDAVASVAEDIVADLHLPDDEGDRAAIRVAEQIEKYLIEKWQTAHLQRWLQPRLDAIPGRLDKVLADPTNHSVAFCLVAEAQEAERILQERGYCTRIGTGSDLDEVVEFWKKGEKEPDEDWL